MERTAPAASEGRREAHRRDGGEDLDEELLVGTPALLARLIQPLGLRLGKVLPCAVGRHATSCFRASAWLQCSATETRDAGLHLVHAIGLVARAVDQVREELAVGAARG